MLRVVTAAVSLFVRSLLALIDTLIRSEDPLAEHYCVHDGKPFTTVKSVLVTSNNPNAQTALTVGEYLQVFDHGAWHLCRVEQLLKRLDQGGYFMICRMVNNRLCSGTSLSDVVTAVAIQYVPESMLADKLPVPVHSQGVIETSSRKVSVTSLDYIRRGKRLGGADTV